MTLHWTLDLVFSKDLVQFMLRAAEGRSVTDDKILEAELPKAARNLHKLSA